MISHRYRCIYIKLPKCGSSTLRDWFLKHGRGRHSFKPWWYGRPLPDRMQSVTNLMNLYPDYATFTFLRDPCERFVSIYLHARRTAAGRARGGAIPAGYGSLAEFAGLCRELLDETGSLWGADMRAFFRNHGDREYGPGRVPLRNLRFEIGHARPQTDFLPDCNPARLFGVARADAAPLSFIGRVADMDEDFRRLCATLGIAPVSLPQRNASGFGVGAERARRYREYYDAAARRSVEEIYAADFAFIGCGFEGGRRTIVPAAGQAAAAAPGHRSALPGKARRLLARLWHTLWSSEVRFEHRIRACAPLLRLLRPLKRPLKRLRGLPR